MTASDELAISERDGKILEIGDENFVTFSWQALREIIGG
jgi:hypothetical protein